MQKQFTPENLARLKELYTDFSFKGEVLEGKFGANTLNPFELLTQTSETTLDQLFSNVTKSIAELAGKSRWRLTTYQQEKQERFKVWGEFLDLLIGYRLSEAEMSAKATEARKLRAEIAKLKEEAKTPEVRLAEMEAKAALLEA